MAQRGVNNLVLTEIQKNAFWSKVDIADNIKDCWNWAGAKKTTGYGNVRINKNYLLAHRVAFILANGDIPDGYIICHICDNPSCCNPSHLMLGTTKSNAADMLIKNRQKKAICASRGEFNGNSKLNREKVIFIRKNPHIGVNIIADIYEVSKTTVRDVRKHKTWRHI